MQNDLQEKSSSHRNSLHIDSRGHLLLLYTQGHLLRVHTDTRKTEL